MKVDLEICHKLAQHLYDQEWTNIEDVSDAVNIPFLGESIKRPFPRFPGGPGASCRRSLSGSRMPPRMIFPTWKNAPARRCWKSMRLSPLRPL